MKIIDKQHMALALLRRVARTAGDTRRFVRRVFAAFTAPPSQRLGDRCAPYAPRQRTPPPLRASRRVSAIGVYRWKNLNNAFHS
jgi:hypothetical protein